MRATTKREDIATKRGALTRAQDEVARARREVNEAETRLRTQQAEADKIAGEIEALRDQAMLGILTPAVVDALAPEHSLKGCSDEDAPNHEGRCARCMLLHGMRNGWFEGRWTFVVGQIA